MRPRRGDGESGYEKTVEGTAARGPRSEASRGGARRGVEAAEENERVRASLADAAAPVRDPASRLSESKGHRSDERRARRGAELRGGPHAGAGASDRISLRRGPERRKARRRASVSCEPRGSRRKDKGRPDRSPT